MTKFISVEEKPQKKKKETVFTKVLNELNDWEDTKDTPKDFDTVLYLGKCKVDGDMFACYGDSFICIFKGVKGDEFND